MGKKESGASISVSWLVIWVVISILGYFVYEQALSGALASLLLYLLLSLVALLGFIPLAGPFLYWFWLGRQSYDFVMELTGLSPTWLTDLIFNALGILSIVFTAIVLFLIWAWRS